MKKFRKLQKPFKNPSTASSNAFGYTQSAKCLFFAFEIATDHPSTITIAHHEHYPLHCDRKCGKIEEKG